MKLEPVDFDPFAASSVENGRVNSVSVRPAAAPRYEPVDHDPFAGPQRSGWDKAAEVAKGLGNAANTGLAHAVAGIGGAAGDLSNLGAAGIQAGTNAVERFMGMPETPAPERAPSMLPTSESMLKQIQKDYYGGEELYKPQNTAEEYAKTAGEFIPGALGGVGRRLMQRAGQVLIPSTISETAGQATKGTAAEPYARFGGALVGGGAASMLSRPGTAAQSIRQQLPEGITPQMVDDAERLIQDAAQRGIPLAWPQALSQVAGRPILTDMMRHLEGSPQTAGRMGEFFAEVPQRLNQAARREFDQIAPVNNAPSAIGPAVGRAAQEEVTATRQAINAVAEPYYTMAAPTRLRSHDFARIQTLPGWDEARQAIRNTPQLNRNVAHLPDDSVGFLNEVKKYLNTSSENAVGRFAQQPNQQLSAGYGADAREVRQAARDVDPRYRTALDFEAQAREQHLQPLLDRLGPLLKDNVKTSNAVKALLKGELGEAEIAQTVTAIANRNPRAAADLVRFHAEKTFNEAVKNAGQTGNVAKGFWKNLVGNPQEAANLEAAFVALRGQRAWQGFHRFLDVAEGLAYREGVGSKTAYNLARDKAGGMGGVARDISKAVTNPLQALQPAMDRYGMWKQGRDMNGLAAIMTDPRSAQLFRAIANAPNETAAVGVALKLITYAEASK